MRVIDLTGQVFGKLTVSKRTEPNGVIRALWLCQCLCEREVTVRGSNLRSGGTKSCGKCDKLNSVEHRPDVCMLTLVRRNGEQLQCFVDAADYERVKTYRWCAHKTTSSHTYYATTNTRKPDGTKTLIYMHRLLFPDAVVVDHKDRNGLNNRRSNLRPATYAQNVHNMKKRGSTSTSEFYGVSKRRGKFVAQLQVNKKQIHIGTFDSETDAAIAFNEVAKLHCGEFARLNAVSQAAG
jgi:hypothetical protein